MSVMLNRRELLGSVTLVVGGIAASAAVPWPAAEAAGAEARQPVPLADWTIDDMWGAYPRYADPIGYARVQPEPVAVAVGSIDALFYV